VFLMEGQHHGSARLINLTDKEKRELRKSLEVWLGMPVTGWLAD
jgi:hypothetical protein